MKIFKYIVYFVIIFIITAIIFRVATSGDPAQSKTILNSENFIKQYEKLENDFVAYKINVRNPFDWGDALRLIDINYLESSQDLQLTIKCKKNRLSELLAVFAKEDLKSYTELIVNNLYLRVGDKNEGNKEINQEEFNFEPQFIKHEVMQKFETNKYEYIRLSFANVNIDYRNSKIELFMNKEGFDGFNEVNLDEDYLARFTIFDINMPKERMKIKKFVEK